MLSDQTWRSSSMPMEPTAQKQALSFAAGLRRICVTWFEKLVSSDFCLNCVSYELACLQAWILLQVSMATIPFISSICSKRKLLMSCSLMRLDAKASLDSYRAQPLRRVLGVHFQLTVHHPFICMPAAPFRIFGMWNIFTITFASRKCSLTDSLQRTMACCGQTVRDRALA